MITAQRIKNTLRSLLDRSNEKTGAEDSNLTDAVDTLVAGYYLEQCVGGLHISCEMNNASVSSQTYVGKISMPSDSQYSLDSVTLNGSQISGTTITTSELSEDITVGSICYSLSSDGVLTISGYGDMQDYTSFTGMPWYEKRDSVTEIVIEEGVTHIGARSFYRCINATKVSIAKSAKSIGASAFYRCDALAEVTYGGYQSEWDAISKDPNNDALTGAEIICSDVTFLRCNTLRVYPGVAIVTDADGLPESFMSAPQHMLVYSSDDSLGAKYQSSYYAIPIPEDFSAMKLSVVDDIGSGLNVTSISLDLYNYDVYSGVLKRVFFTAGSSSGNETIDLSDKDANCMFFELYFNENVPSDYDVSQISLTFLRQTNLI